MENEIKLLGENIEKMIIFCNLHFKICENNFDILRYEIQNNIVQTAFKTSFNVDDYLTEIKCRRCGEQKKVSKHGPYVKHNMCIECSYTLVEEYEEYDEGKIC